MHEFLPSWGHYVDPEIHRSVVEFHSKGNWICSCEMPLGGIKEMSQASIDSATFSQSKPVPHYPQVFQLKPSKRLGDEADYGSTRNFASDQAINSDTLSTLLLRSFAALSQGERLGHRPYPSAGRLYPAEIFLAIHRSANNALPCGIYHYLPVDHALGNWCYGHAIDSVAALGYAGIPHIPPVSFVYFLNLPKAIFKYQYRGYRHGLMEVGSMYQQAKREADKLNLRSHCWSSFSDDLISRWIGLHPEHYIPVLVQSFGFGVEGDHDR